MRKPLPQILHDMNNCWNSCNITSTQSADAAAGGCAGQQQVPNATQPAAVPAPEVQSVAGDSGKNIVTFSSRSHGTEATNLQSTQATINFASRQDFGVIARGASLRKK
jgi:hypothetical protein